VDERQHRITGRLLRLLAGLVCIAAHAEVLAQRVPEASCADSVVYAIVVDPSNSSQVLAGTNDGLLVSENGGATWTRRRLVPRDQIFGLALDATDPSTLWAATGQGLSRSRDRGVTWEMMSLPAYHMPKRDLLWARRDGFYPDLVEATAAGFAHGKYSFKTIVVDPGPEPTVLAGSLGIFRSVDRGDHWRRIAVSSLQFPDLGIHALVVDPFDRAAIYAATDGGIFVSGDFGASWHALSTSFFATTLLADPQTPHLLYAGTGKTGVRVSDDAGRTWSPSGVGLATASIRSLAVGPGTPGIVYAGTEGEVFKSTDRGASWTPSPLPSGAALAIAIDPTTPTTVYVGTEREIWKSTVGGGHWQQLCPPA
jgi:photosystem II stability/assembly factor-like uncharacterized protein